MNHDQKYIDWQDQLIRYPHTKNQLRTFKYKKDITRKLNSSVLANDYAFLNGVNLHFGPHRVKMFLFSKKSSLCRIGQAKSYIISFFYPLFVFSL